MSKQHGFQYVEATLDELDEISSGRGAISAPTFNDRVLAFATDPYSPTLEGMLREITQEQFQQLNSTTLLAGICAP